MERNWRFARKPFWIFSHVFVLAAIVLFVNLSLWQISRLNEKQAFNKEIASKAFSDPVNIEKAVHQKGANFQKVSGEVKFLESDLVRIFNRSQNGMAGEHVVAVAEMASGEILFVNRGFVPLGTTDLPPMSGSAVVVEGWLRDSVEKGFFEVSDVGEGKLLPRFNIQAIQLRYQTEKDISPVWLQIESYEGLENSGMPLTVPLPEVSEGSHKSYAIQWIIFAFLVLIFYVAILRRTAAQ